MKANWLDPDEQIELCKLLLRHDLIRFSNQRDMVLSSGIGTDIYITIRNARGFPAAMKRISEYFTNPLMRLSPNRFAEVPDAVSCFAPLISTQTNIPYITLRQHPKEGRVSKPTAIGPMAYGDSICLFDYVITDGESKIYPYRECLRLGLRPEHLVVLVDRQQGWQGNFEKQNINLPVWAGMTLHDVRRFLVESGNMERCNLVVEKRNPIIVALDGKSWEEILPIVDQLRTTGCIFKVTDLFLAKGGEWLLPNLSVYGQVMVDIKSHDIGNTVENVAKLFRACPPWAITVHASGHQDMIRRAVEALRGTPPKVLAVTVLTSFNEKMCEDVYVRRPIEEVKQLAAIADEGGAHGFVSAAEECTMIRGIYEYKHTLVVPAIRSPGVPSDDQQRTSTPHDAYEHGANHLIIGRQILRANDPVAEVHRILTEELGIR